MKNLIVVSEPSDWPLEVPGSQVVAAWKYLTDSRYVKLANARVFNLCRSYRYQRTGYYVSLLAEARGHRPLPSIRTIQEVKSQTLLRIAAGDLDETIQKSLEPIRAGEFILSVYFGRNVSKRHGRLARALFLQFPAPFLRAGFVRNDRTGQWQLQSLDPIAAEDIPLDHREFVVEVARDYFAARQRKVPARPGARYDLAILVNPEEEDPPSNERALARFEKAAESVGFAVEFIGKEDFGRLAEFDALFLRETTAVNHRTFRFATKAAAEGLAVIDDPDSILKCSNKVFLAEVLVQNDVPTPRTQIVHRRNARTVARNLGLPCVLKQPDSAFSRGVVKVETRDQLETEVARLLERSDLIVAQEFLPTDFDWRVGVFEGEPLYVCKYYMAPNHWQIIRRGPKRSSIGRGETLAVEAAPRIVVDTALRACALIGKGLFGVDLKEAGGKVHVIEINDNPNVDADIEDAVLKDELYLRIMRGLVARVERRKGGSLASAGARP